MAEHPKRKWKLNLFDIIIICIAAAAAFLLLKMGGSDGGIVSSGTRDTVRYTVELTAMTGDTAELIKSGDELVDKVEKRTIGKVVSATVTPYRELTKDYYTGRRFFMEVPGKKTAVVVVEASATVTESEISIGGYIVRAGTEVSINGPLYSGSGYIISVERGDNA